MKKYKKIINNKKIIKEIINEMQSDKPDPNGSYTGVPADKAEVPSQDADDL